MHFDLTSLRKAVSSLDGALAAVETARAAALGRNLQDAIRAGVIQNFEFTYELCWKFMRRWLAANVGRAQVEGVTRRELFRLAAEHRLVEQVEDWMEFHDARNETVHVYDENKAQETLALARRFLPAAQGLLSILERRNG